MQTVNNKTIFCRSWERCVRVNTVNYNTPSTANRWWHADLLPSFCPFLPLWQVENAFTFKSAHLQPMKISLSILENGSVDGDDCRQKAQIISEQRSNVTITVIDFSDNVLLVSQTHWIVESSVCSLDWLVFF